jgi:hypothetical protein
VVRGIKWNLFSSRTSFQCDYWKKFYCKRKLLPWNAERIAFSCAVEQANVAVWVCVSFRKYPVRELYVGNSISHWRISIAVRVILKDLWRAISSDIVQPDISRGGYWRQISARTCLATWKTSERKKTFSSRLQPFLQTIYSVGWSVWSTASSFGWESGLYHLQRLTLLDSVSQRPRCMPTFDCCAWLGLGSVVRGSPCILLVASPFILLW